MVTFHCLAIPDAEPNPSYLRAEKSPNGEGGKVQSCFCLWVCKLWGSVSLLVPSSFSSDWESRRSPWRRAWAEWTPPWASKSFSGRLGRSEVEASGTASLQLWREGLLSCITESSRFETWWEKVSCCEKKMSPAISIHKKCHIHQWFLGSRCERGLPKLWSNRWGHHPTVTAEELGGCKKQSSATPEGEQGNRFGPRELRCTWKEWIQWAQRLASSET